MDRNLLILLVIVILISSVQGNTQAAVLTTGQPGTNFRYVQTFGETQVPYLADTGHLNNPVGLFVDGSNNLFVTEEWGFRVLKYNSTGGSIWSLGKAGVSGTDQYVFSHPTDTAIDQNGNVWVADANRIVEYDASGVFIRQLPETQAQNAGSDNTHFNDTWGIAVDTGGRLYVSDRNNHRVQVYDLSTGSPVYSSTVGVTGQPGSNNAHFNQPFRIALDNLNNLFVADSGNNRVQKCSYSGAWVCTTFDTGYGLVQGLTVDNNNAVYASDMHNAYVRKCTAGGVCINFGAPNVYYTDLAVDSNGFVYGTQPWGNSTVTKVNSSGQFPTTFAGVPGVPYLTDGYHYNRPRVTTDFAGNILISEEMGQRVVKLDPNGTLLWTYGGRNMNCGANWGAFCAPVGIAADSTGRIFIADSSACRVFILNSDGTPYTSLGQGCGTGDYQFGEATGVAIDQFDNIYVVDRSNQRVEIFNKNLVFTSRIGQTGVCDLANNHFCQPQSVAVDSAGSIYVTERGNNRVQKFSSSLQWQMSIGTNNWGEQFDQFAWPEDVDVDSQGKIYISDWTNQRIQVFDSTGAYLTAIGGDGGVNTGQFIGAVGVSVDRKGNVFTSDWENNRIHKFAPDVRGWKQVNINGFDSRRIEAIPSMGTFAGYLYASTADFTINDYRLYRTQDGNSWVRGLTSFSSGISALKEYKNKLYLGTWAGEIWSSPNGAAWTRVFTSTWGISHFSVFNDALFAGTYTDAALTGEVLYKTTDGVQWDPLVSNGNGTQSVSGILSSAEFHGLLYLGAADWTNTTGAHIWRTNGITLTEVVSDGFGSPGNLVPGGMAVLADQIYVSVGQADGFQVWRSPSGEVGSWEKVLEGSPSNPGTTHYTSMAALDNQLFLVVENSTNGLQVWSTNDGRVWSKASPAGLGDSNNTRSEWSNGLTIFNNKLYLAIPNSANGAEIWQKMFDVYMPLMPKN